MFKAARPDSGEDWAEKAAERLCAMIGVPHARYELAVSADHKGVVSPAFVFESESLVHGNELLAGADAKYALAAEEEGGRTSAYTPALALATIEASQVKLRPEWALHESTRNAASVFVGYLIHDAWVGNTDRHEENWAVIESTREDGGIVRFLAPQFDTASCLGRNESDARRIRRLNRQDPQSTVETYADRARSPFFGSADATRPLSPLQAFLLAAQLHPDAGRAWLARIRQVQMQQVADMFEEFPADRVSQSAKEFALAMLDHNLKRLLDLEGQF